MVFAPVEPVEHDVVDRDVAAAILAQHAEQLFLRGVALPALPETVRPARQHHGATSELAVASDDVVQIFARDEVVIERVGHLGRQ